MNKKEMIQQGIAERTIRLIDLDIEMISEFDHPSTRIYISEQVGLYHKAKLCIAGEMGSTAIYRKLCRKLNKLDFLVNGVESEK